MTHRMKRFLAIVSVVAAAAVPSRAAESLRPEEFSAQFPLANVVEGLNAVELTESVYRAAEHRLLNDLRVFNGRGEALPFAVLPPSPPAAPDVRAFELALAPLPARAAARDAALQ